jgi:hypothetical protein
VTEIRSYRRVFDLERRIYSVDRLRLNPGGLPLRGVVYLLTLAGASLILSRIPWLGLPLRAVPWYLGDLVLPAGAASILTVVRIDGRASHLAAGGVLRLLLGPRRVSRLHVASDVGRRWRPPMVVMLPDGSDHRFRRFSYSGPGAVLVLLGHTREGAEELGDIGFARRRATLRIESGGTSQRGSRGEVILLERGTRLLVARSDVHGR